MVNRFNIDDSGQALEGEMSLWTHIGHLDALGVRAAHVSEGELIYEEAKLAAEGLEAGEVPDQRCHDE